MWAIAPFASVYGQCRFKPGRTGGSRTACAHLDDKRATRRGEILSLPRWAMFALLGQSRMTDAQTGLSQKSEHRPPREGQDFTSTSSAFIVQIGACRAGTTSSPRFESALAGHARERRDGPHEFARVFRGL